VTFFLPVFPVFFHDRKYREALIVRPMTCWLERAVHVHKDAVLEAVTVLKLRNA
jgi:hypothetical protein